MTALKPIRRGAAALLLAVLGVPFAASGRAAGVTGAGTLPAALRPSLYRALARDLPGPAIGPAGCVTLPGASLGACFRTGGATFAAAASPMLALRLVRFGRRGAWVAAGEPPPRIRGRRATYVHARLREWWRVLPIGFEQGFTITRRPPGPGPLDLILAANRPAAADGTALAWGRIRYGGLVVTDARGRRIAATLLQTGDRILISIRDRDARYPLTVDPLVWITQKVTASDGAAGDEFGWAVAVSGNNVLIGAPYASTSGSARGAVYAFAESNGNWKQTQKLLAMDGRTGDAFGAALALDGSTAFVGAPDANVNGNIGEGAVYVFTLGSQGWVQATKIPRPSPLAGAKFGYTVALAGGTALIGGNAAQSQNNLVYVFTGSGAAWVPSATLVDGISGEGFGESVAVAPATALVGAPAATVNGLSAQGVAYVYTLSGGVWTQSERLAAIGGAANDAFGTAVALAGPGTAVIGAPHATVGGNSDSGAAYVFSYANGNWSQQQLVPGDASAGAEFGASLAVTPSELLVGAPLATVGKNTGQGAVYAFSVSNGRWIQVQKITASDGAASDEFGSALGLEGTTDVVGAPLAAVGGRAGQGAGYLHAPSDLTLDLTAPASADTGAQYISQSILSNSSGSASAAVAVDIPVPTGTTYLSAIANQGSCSFASGTVSCGFGPLAADGGSASATVKFKVTGAAGSTIDNTAAVSAAIPPLTASAPTRITGSGGGGGGGSSGGGGAIGAAGLGLLAVAGLLALLRRRS